MILERLIRRSPHPSPQRRLYDEIVAQARQPWFYAETGVADTLDGRYDMIVLHAVLIFDRLSRADERAREFAQAVFDEMFRDMDRSLREMGVGDLAVGRQVRRMAEVFYGRLRAYSEALSRDGEVGRAALAAALARNVFADPQAPGAFALADYALAERRALAGQPLERLLSGEAGFSPSAPA